MTMPLYFMHTKVYFGFEHFLISRFHSSCMFTFVSSLHACFFLNKAFIKLIKAFLGFPSHCLVIFTHQLILKLVSYWVIQIFQASGGLQYWY